jgi:response regulator RpfG family c-di-GMP phosphodiesterase
MGGGIRCGNVEGLYTIVIVNDSPCIVDLFSTFLIRRGYRVIGTYSSEECLELLGQETADLILSNISRWPMDGWEFTERVKKNPQTHALPVIITSAQEYTPQHRLRYGNLIEEYVYLPVGEQELCNVIDLVLRRRTQPVP